MRRPHFLFYRGSSPTLELVLPLRLEPSDTVYATLSQHARTALEYAINGSGSPAGTGSLSLAPDAPDTLLLSMTQTDTLALAAGDCALQLRVKTQAGADTFPPLHGFVGQTQKEGLI